MTKEELLRFIRWQKNNLDTIEVIYHLDKQADIYLHETKQLNKPCVIKSFCEIPNCNKTEYRIGWCKYHYNLLCRNRAK